MRSIFRFIAALAVLALMPFMSSAQEEPTFTLKFGAVRATQTYDYHDLQFVFEGLRPDYRWGFAAGGEIRLLDIAGADILAELLYVQKGFSIDVWETGPNYPDEPARRITLKPRIDYLTLTCSVKWRLFPGPFAPYARFGPRADVYLTKDPDGLTAIDFRAADIGATLGVGAEFSLGPLPRLSIEGRFSPDITKAYDGTFVRVHNTSFEILAGIGL